MSATGCSSHLESEYKLFRRRFSIVLRFRIDVSTVQHASDVAIQGCDISTLRSPGREADDHAPDRGILGVVYGECAL